MLTIAIDLGKFNSVACIYNTQTQKQRRAERARVAEPVPRKQRFRAPKTSLKTAATGRLARSSVQVVALR